MEMVIANSYTHTHLFVYAHKYVCNIHIHKNLCTCVYIYMHVYIYMYTCICVYVCTSLSLSLFVLVCPYEGPSPPVSRPGPAGRGPSRPRRAWEAANVSGLCGPFLKGLSGAQNGCSTSRGPVMRP